MANTAALKTSIYSLLATKGTTYEYNRVPDSVSNPYIVYHLTSGFNGLSDDSYCRQYVLDIDVFYKTVTKNTDTLETLIDNIENLLIDKKIITTSFTCDFIEPLIQNDLPTTDEFMFRRRITYTLKYYESE